MKTNYLLVFLLGFMLSAHTSFAKDGGVDTGGGSIVTTITGETGLIDYFTHASELFGKSDQRTQLMVPKTKNLSSSSGIDEISLKSLGAWPPLSERINNWKTTSPVMTEYLESALNNISIFFVNSEIDIVDRRYFIPANLKSKVSSLNTVAFYMKNIGLVISKPEFERLRYEDQLGLLMKEILRHIQITYETDFTAEQLQHLNAVLAIGPKNNETLDSVSYYSEKMLSKIQDKKRIENTKQKFFDDLKAYNQKYKLDIFKNNNSISDIIGTLSSRLESISNAEEAFDVRILIRNAFKVLDGDMVNKLKYNQSLVVMDLVQKLNFNRIMLDINLKK